MSDWQVGDLAVCVDDSPAHDGSNGGLVAGCVYRVVGISPHGLSKYGQVAGLHLAEITPAAWSVSGYAHVRFRKIRPDEQEGNAEDWQLLRETHKRKVSA